MAVTAPPTDDSDAVWTIVVAAGSSTRFGRPKLLESLGSARVVDHAVADAVAASDGVVVVTSSSEISDGLLVDAVVPGGATRSESVRAGLSAIPSDVALVLVHDAARPGAGVSVFERVIDALRAGADAVVPAVAVSDTIKRVDGRYVMDTPDRAALVAVQTPQGFTAAALRSAHSAAIEATDDAAVIEAAGGTVVTVEGAIANEKITTTQDLVHARARWAVRADHEEAGTPMGEMRIGHGFDMHRISDDPERPMVLGGVRFDGVPGLVGHSDADAVTHAVIDAVLAAAGLGDIGQQFPDTDEQHAGADSMDLLGVTMGLVADEGWRVVNVDCTVIADRPKLAPRRSEMESLLSAACSGVVTVKGKTTEGVGALGRGDAVVAQAVALLERA